MSRLNVLNRLKIDFYTVFSTYDYIYGDPLKKTPSIYNCKWPQTFILDGSEKEIEWAEETLLAVASEHERKLNKLQEPQEKLGFFYAIDVSY